MTQRLLDVVVVNVPGQHPAGIAKWPEGGAFVQAALTVGTAVVRLRGYNDVSTPRDEIVEFTLPVPVGEAGAGNLVDSVQLPSSFAYFDWLVVSLTGGGQLKLSVCGVGV